VAQPLPVSGNPQEPPEQALPKPELPELDTANTESCFSTLLLPHLGHTASSLPRIRVSKRLWQLGQAYSKIGMFSPETGLMHLLS
jgi:hypothetical protein